MIPSDHFVYFYNEIFKFLEKKGPEALDRYYQRVARRQADFALKPFKERGLRGMYEYWERIRIEENCDSVNDLHEAEGYYQSRQNRCPSLTKALESDAGACGAYCNHCPGWVLRVMTRAGYYCVFNIKDRKVAQCEKFVSGDRALAETKKREWLRTYSPDLVFDNFDEVERTKRECFTNSN